MVYCGVFLTCSLWRVLGVRVRSLCPCSRFVAYNSFCGPSTYTTRIVCSFLIALLLYSTEIYHKKIVTYSSVISILTHSLLLLLVHNEFYLLIHYIRYVLTHNDNYLLIKDNQYILIHNA